MIRPLTNENELQNLEKTPLEELRNEFVDQVYSLRSKIFQEVKVKRIQGQDVNGQVWVSLISNYVETINKGDIPDIQNSWHYICDELAAKLIQQLKDEWEKECQEFLTVPMNEMDMENELDQIKKILLKKFDKEIKGEVEVVDRNREILQKFIQEEMEKKKSINQFLSLIHI